MKDSEMAMIAGAICGYIARENRHRTLTEDEISQKFDKIIIESDAQQLAAIAGISPVKAMSFKSAILDRSESL